MGHFETGREPYRDEAVRWKKEKMKMNHPKGNELTWCVSVDGILRQGSRAEVGVEVIKSAKESLAQVSQRRIGRQRV